MTPTRPLSVLYVVYWGAAEPLGQSLVLPAVEHLARLGVRMTLVTFDKPDDLRDKARIAAIRQRLEVRDVRWLSLRYHRHPQLPAKLWDILHAVVRGVITRLSGPIDLVHARTFVGGLIGLPLARLLQVPLVYHNEGFYPDEQVDGGVWTKGSRAHRIARALEAKLYASAPGIIALSNRAQATIESLPDVRSRNTPVIVVPSAVDLDRFRLPESRPTREGEVLKLVYIGSVGRRYIFDRIVAFAAAAHRELGDVRFRVLAPDKRLAGQILSEAGLPTDAWSVETLPHAAMPEELARHDVGLFFLMQGLSEHGCSPTKIGEYWACGLPVVTTPNVSDTDAIVRREGVGVVVTEHSPAGYRKAIEELQALLMDPELSMRCRRAAEAHYGLVPACDRQVVLYRQIAT